MTKSGENFVRIFDVGKMIGADRSNGFQQTSWMSVVTNKMNNLLSAYPGKADIKK
jgi:hypothetical protein